MSRSLLALALVLVVVVLVFALRDPEAGDSAPPRVEEGEAVDAEVALVDVDREDAERTARVPVDDKTTAEPREASPLPPAPPGDGFLVRVLDADDEPVPRLPIQVHWRKGWGNYGDDLGVTDEAGCFRSTVHRLDELEAIAIPEGEFEGLDFYHPFAPHPARPGEIVLVLPGTGRLVGRVVDGVGEGLAEALLHREPRETLSAAPWRHRLCEDDDPVPVPVDSDGRFAIEVHEGYHMLNVEAFEYVGLHEVLVYVGRGEEVEVVVEVVRLGEAFEVLVVVPPSMEEPPTLRLLHDGAAARRGAASGESLPVEVDFRGRLVSTEGNVHRYTLRRPGVNPDGWRLWASMGGCQSATLPLAEAGDSPTLHLGLSPPRIRRELTGRVRTRSGEGVKADLFVNDDDGLRTSSNHSSRRDGTFVLSVGEEDEVFLRVTARGYGHVAVGPIDLAGAPPELDIVLEETLPITGMCVDSEGLPVSCHVTVHRSRSMIRSGAGRRRLPVRGSWTYPSAPTGGERGTRDASPSRRSPAAPWSCGSSPRIAPCPPRGRSPTEATTCAWCSGKAMKSAPRSRESYSTRTPADRSKGPRCRWDRPPLP